MNEIGEKGGAVKLGWVKAHMGILGNEAADVMVKKAAEVVPLGDNEKWMFGGGIRQWTRQRNMKYVEGGRRGGFYQESDRVGEKSND